MAQDIIRTTLRLLVEMDREAVRVAKLLARILGASAASPVLSAATFKVAGKTYKGMLTAEQRAQVTKAGNSPDKVHRVLVKLLGKVDRALADSLARIKTSLKTGAKGRGTTPEPLGACDYFDPNNIPRCADDLNQQQCTALNGMFHAGETCVERSG